MLLMVRLEGTCICVKTHIPKPSVGAMELHHILPRMHGGTNDPENLVWLCATGHNNVHIYIRTGKGGNAYQKTIAQRGIDAILASHGYDKPTAP